tara:strand:- start:1316 stop:1567 length:252 start_codon:yes stop_codon:yes gene_type:complete
MAIIVKRILFLFVASVLIGSVTADAQSRSRNVILIEAEEVQGEVQIPDVTVIFARQNLDSKDRLNLRESFIPRIIQSVDSSPF